MKVAIIGVIGTLAGTLLGWILNNVSKRGRLKVFKISFNEKFMYNQLN